MVKATQQTKNSLPAQVESRRLAPTALSPDMFAADAGQGMEGAGQESFAIPFLSVLQKGSPQVDEASGQSIDGAKAGMFFENVTGKLFDGKAGVTVIPCAYRRAFLRWGPRSGEGSGFKGELTADAVIQMRSAGQIVELDGKLFVPSADGSTNPLKCDRISDTRNHYVLLVDEETGAWTQALLSLTSTQIKKSKMLMSALASVKLSGAAGLYTPPTFANKVIAKTIPESNDKGTWHGVKFELAGTIDRPDLYAAAKAFHASVVKGSVDVKYEDTDESVAPIAGDRF